MTQEERRDLIIKGCANNDSVCQEELATAFDAIGDIERDWIINEIARNFYVDRKLAEENYNTLYCKAFPNLMRIFPRRRR
jgi:hypothetical protein